MSCDVVIRDSEGMVHASCACKVKGAHDALATEAMAIVEILGMARDFGLPLYHC
ncbi:hypothetical protein PVK06_018834 [Gossypium arboreum]|uniref:RNase H type-1 domain-containing protein n=1 Tax=Gossypium arboreum TaxID=29729 RepID=A0ABR0PI18_GOSAR|nr:hypothetical protein PVK06_018834 [Gossypium arboreum]